MSERPPRGWHRYDRTCECAACERTERSSPYLKVRRGAVQRGQFDRAWPWMVALAALGAVVFVALIALGYLPLWLWFV